MFENKLVEMWAEVIRRLLLFVSQWIKTVEEKAMAQRMSMQWVCAIEMHKVGFLEQQIWFDMLNKPWRLETAKRELKHGQNKFAALWI